MKYFLYVFCFCFLISCVSVKTNYTDNELYPEKYPIKQIFEKFDAGGSDKSIIVFTSGFVKDTIKVINNYKTIKEGVVESTPQTGFGGFQAVSNETPVEIHVLTNKLVKISLKEEDLKKYKFVYISRDAWKRRKYTIEYSNEWKAFM